MARDFWWVSGYREPHRPPSLPIDRHAEWLAHIAAVGAPPPPTDEELAPLGVWRRDGELAVSWRPHPQWAAVLLGDLAWSGVSVRAGVLPWREIRPWQDVPEDPRPVMAGSWAEAVALARARWDRDRGVWWR